MLVAASVGLFLAGGGNIYRSHAIDVERYATKSTIHTVTVADWWGKGWQTLPVRRIDLTGEVEEPLVFQWAGSLQDLQDSLQQGGWRPSTAWTFEAALTWLTGGADAGALPVVPQFAGGHLPDTIFVRPFGPPASPGLRFSSTMGNNEAHGQRPDATHSGWVQL